MNMKFTSIINKINRKLVARQIAFGSDDAQTNDIRVLIMDNGIDYTNAGGLDDVIRVRATKANNTPEKVQILEAIAANLETPAQSWTAARESRINGKRKMVFTDTTDDQGNTITAAEAYRAAMFATMQINYKSVKKTQTAAFTAAGAAMTGSKGSSTRGSKQGSKDKNQGRPRSILMSVDIETNQFYNYAMFMHRDFSKCYADSAVRRAAQFKGTHYKNADEIKAKAEECLTECFAVIESEKAKIAADLKRVDYIAGLDLWFNIHDKLEAIIKDRAAHFEAYIDRQVFIDVCSSTIDEKTYSTKREVKSLPVVENSNGWIMPSHAEIYLIGVTYWKPEEIVNGSKKAWYDMTHEQFQKMITEKSAAAKSGFKHYESFHTIPEFEKWLAPIIDQTLIENKTIFMSAHNLSYEANLLFTNCDFMKEAVKAGRVEYLANAAKDSFKCFDVYACPPVVDDKGKEVKGSKLIEGRCSWKLTGKSVSELGKKFNYEKNGNGDAYDYNKVRQLAPRSPLFYGLEREDYDYNRIDCEIAAMGTHEVYHRYPEISRTNRTFYSANNVIKVVSNEDCKEHKIKPDWNQKSRTMDLQQYKDFHKTSHGGLVAVNTELAGQLIYKGYDLDYCGEDIEVKDFFHIDLNSAHPSQAFTKLFPVSAGEEVTGPELLNVCFDLEKSFRYVRDITAQLGDKPEDYVKLLSYGVDTIVLMQYYNTKARHTVNRSGYGVFRLTNVSLKEYPHAGSIPCLPVAIQTDPRSNLTKEEEEAGMQAFPGVNIKSTSGKLTSADEITISATAEDLVIYSLFYNFEFEVLRFVRYDMGLCSKKIVRQFKQHGGRKVFYKELENAVKNHDDSEDYIEADKAAGIEAKKGVKGVYNKAIELAKAHQHDQYIDKADYEYIIKLMKQGDFEAAKTYAGNQLKFAKAQFNGIYGTNYQSMLRRSYSLMVDDSNEIQTIANESGDGVPAGTEFQEKDKQNVDFMHGAYIAQNTRIDIALYMAAAMNLGAIPLYIATDSIYGIISQHSHPETVDILTSCCYNQQATGLTAGGKFKKFGAFDELGFTDFTAAESSDRYRQISRLAAAVKNGPAATRKQYADIVQEINDHNAKQMQIKKSRHIKKIEIDQAKYNEILRLLDNGAADEAEALAAQYLATVTDRPYENVWKLGGMDLETKDGDIQGFAYTMCLKCIALCEKQVEIKDPATGKDVPFTESNIIITFSGCDADTFFKNCNRTKIDTGIEGSKPLNACTLEDFREHFQRLTMMNGYCGPFDGARGKKSKIKNNEALTPEEGYVLAPVPFVNNNTLTSLPDDSNLKTFKAASHFGTDWSK